MVDLPEHMKAVVFHGPYDIRTEQRKVPRIQDQTDAIIKVKYSGLCGTDLHSYRNHIKGPVGQIIGHEFLGTIVDKGSEIDDSEFSIGDDVLCTFTIQCGCCWYCKNGYSGQCKETNTFGKIGLDGGQAEYVRVPYATSSLIKKPLSSSPIDDSVYVLMSDIFITGYYGVKKILNFLNQEQSNGKIKGLLDVSILQIGLGPVGLCGLHVMKHLGFKKIVCVDNVPSRLDEAKRIGAYKVYNFDTDSNMKEIVAEVTNGIGFDAVLEAVGASSALKSSYEYVRGNGYISSLGMGHEPLPFNGLECYLKNINISFGRCHAWSLFPEALEIFEEIKSNFAKFVDYKTDLDSAKQAFELFDAHKVNKVVFDLT